MLEKADDELLSWLVVLRFKMAEKYVNSLMPYCGIIL